MRICIDARSVKATMTGLGRYALNLVRHLAAIDTESEYIVLRHQSYGRQLVGQRNFSEIVLPYEITTLRNVMQGHRVIDALDADVYHSLFHMLPIRLRSKCVVITLHDLIWVTDIDLSHHDRMRRALHHHVSSRLIGRAIRRATHIIAVSDATRDAALRHYSLPRERITTIPHGVDLFDHQRAAPRSDGPCDDPFILFLGHCRPYKNGGRLLQAFQRVAAVHPAVRLVVAGRGDGFQILQERAAALGIARRVSFLRKVDDCTLRVLLGRAVFLAFPSLIEGFGLPLLEAMAAGCPVLTADVPPMSQIVDGAAVLVSPYDVESIANGMHRLLREESLRCDLTTRGRRRAAAFSWMDTARKTRDIYEFVVQHRARG